MVITDLLSVNAATEPDKPALIYRNPESGVRDSLTWLAWASAGTSACC